LPNISKIFGQWYFDSVRSAHQNASAAPTWIKDAANFISIAFVQPSEITSLGDKALTFAMVTHIKQLQAMGLYVVISIGGASFSGDWDFLADRNQTENAANVAVGWAQKHNVGIEIDYEGSGGWTCGKNKATVATPLLNIGHFIETFRSAVPVGKGVLTLDVYAAQGGGPGLTYLINRYLPGSSTTPDFCAGSEAGLVTNGKTLDFINIMVAGSDDPKTIQTFVEGYVGKNAQIAGSGNAQRIFSPVLPSRATVSMNARDNCATSGNLLPVVEYARKIGLRGIMQWAIAPYGCGPGSWNNPLRVSDWDCNCNANSPGMIAGKAAFLAPANDAPQNGGPV
jgi:hypothetical protein